MTTYAIKVQNTMRPTNPRYSTEGPMKLYHYIGKNGWMSGQSLYMEKVVYNPIVDKNYIGIVTVLDYETSVRKCLSSVLIGTQNRIERKVIVDLALKVGVNEYRFVVYDITDDGKILWNSSKYITPCEDIVKLANSFIRQKSDILSNSMLSNATQAILYCSDERRQGNHF